MNKVKDILEEVRNREGIEHIYGKSEGIEGNKGGRGRRGHRGQWGMKINEEKSMIPVQRYHDESHHFIC